MPTLSSDERERLATFVLETVQLLKELATDRLDLFPQDLQPSVKAAWTEFERDFDSAQADLTVRAMQSDRATWAGLYGSQLQLKLAVVQYWRDKWEASKTAFGLGKGFGKKILKKLIDAIDTVLGSIIAATGLDEALRELKDIFNNSIDEDED
jgi:hypothetical protein